MIPPEPYQQTKQTKKTSKPAKHKLSLRETSKNAKKGNGLRPASCGLDLEAKVTEKKQETRKVQTKKKTKRQKTTTFSEIDRERKKYTNIGG